MVSGGTRPSYDEGQSLTLDCRVTGGEPNSKLVGRAPVRGVFPLFDCMAFVENLFKPGFSTQFNLSLGFDLIL